MTAAALQAQRQHLAQLLEAVQRCGFHLQADAHPLRWLADRGER